MNNGSLKKPKGKYKTFLKHEHGSIASEKLWDMAWEALNSLNHHFLLPMAHWQEAGVRNNWKQNSSIPVWDAAVTSGVSAGVPDVCTPQRRLRRWTW